ncbi:unnamed protein product [Musa hybrid cultivar]
MYEVPLPSATSPHLRRAGSKPIFTDQDSTEPGVANDLGLLFPTKVLLFLMWGISCCKIGWDSVMQMNTDKRHLFLYEAFLYFNPLLLVTLMVWLWGVNLWVFLNLLLTMLKYLILTTLISHIGRYGRLFFMLPF